MAAADTIERTLTVDEAVALGIQWLRIGRYDDASLLLTRILDAVPNHAAALHFSGVLAQQQGRPDEAVSFIGKSIALEPEIADWQSNFAIVLGESGNTEGAVAACRRAIALAPEHANAYNNLGVLLKSQGRFDESEDAYRAALAIDPNHADALMNLATAVGRRGCYAQAVDLYLKSIVIRPAAVGRNLLAYAYTKLGQPDKAIAIYEDALRENANDAVAVHMIAALTGRRVPERASDRFVEETFDSFAATFEAKLERLGYQAPELVTTALARSGISTDKRLDVLDAGCGTGLCGRLLSPYSRRLTGVDLSSGMLALAKQKNVYDLLVRAELTSFLEGAVNAFDVIASADTLVYFGALEQVLAAAASALRPGGLLVFTLEEADESSAPEGARLAFHGRYGHTSRYVTTAVERAGLWPEISQAELRLEGGEPVVGLVVLARKPDAASASDQ